MQPTSIIPAPNLFPSANVVYVDNDFKKLRSKGLLAYRTMEEGVAAWRTGGAASNKYGTPSATNPAAIIVGAGTIECAFGATPQCFVDVDFLSIIGQGIDVTILTSSAGTVTHMLQFTKANYTLRDLTIKAPTTAAEGLFQSGVTTWSGVWQNVKVTGNPTNTLVQMTSNHEGRIINCIFDGSNVTTSTVTSFKMQGSCYHGSFVGCQFLGGNSQNVIVSFTADYQGRMQACEFRGDVIVALFKTTGGSGGFGTIEGCFFECETSAIAFQATNVAAGFSFIACAINKSAGKCVSILANDRTKFVNCGFVTLTGNNDCIELLTGSTFVNASNCRLLGAGNGLAINSADVINANITNCALKMPTGNTPGSSVSSNITNIAAGGGSSNEEILNSQQY